MTTNPLLALRQEQKRAIEEFLRKDIYLHIYELGDLDDFFWPHTEWYGFEENGIMQALLLIYQAMRPPILLALPHETERELTLALLENCRAILNPPLYVHTGLDFENYFKQHYIIQHHGEHLKMRLQHPELSDRIDVRGTSAVHSRDIPEIEQLYLDSYPDHAFDPRMLETGQFYCYRKAGKIVSVAGIHVYSERYNVAAIGNVVTHPDFRGRGFGTCVTARTVQSIRQKIAHVGLNVKNGNQAAIHSYNKLGFTIHARYVELTILRRRP